MKKIPERRCVGCGESFPKSSLIRVVKTPEGDVEIDATGKRNGRGAYICKKSECFRLAVKKKRFASNLGVEIPAELLEGLEKRVSELEKESGGNG